MEARDHSMHDRFTIYRNGETFIGLRYLRRENAAVYQSVFYLGRCRADAAPYSRFACDDECMNIAARQMLTELVDQAAAHDERALK
jgi:hypothetical protein